MESSGSAIVDFGRFCTAFLVVMGIGMEFPFVSHILGRRCGGHNMGTEANVGLITALPVLLAHTGHIVVPAMAMSIIGGLLIYGTVISFTLFFQEEQDF